MAFFGKKSPTVALNSMAELIDLAQQRPVLVDFWRHGCQPCRTMSGIIDELATEFEGSAWVVKADTAHFPDAVAMYRIQATPTFLVVSARPGTRKPTPRFRASGLVKKDVLSKALISAGARPANA